MRRTIWKHALAMVAALAVGASASANDPVNSKPLIFDTDGDGKPDTEFLNFTRNDFDFDNDGLPDTILTYFAPMPAGKDVIGFSFHGEYWDDGPGDFTWWASDLQMRIVPPAGEQRGWTVGGYDDVFLGASDENWNGWNGSSPGATFANGGVLPFSAFPNDGQNFDRFGDQIGVELWAQHFPWKEDPQEKEGPWRVDFALDWSGGTQDGIRPMEWRDVSIILHNIPAPGSVGVMVLAGLVAPRRRRR